MDITQDLITDSTVPNLQILLVPDGWNMVKELHSALAARTWLKSLWTHLLNVFNRKGMLVVKRDQNN